MPFDEPTTNHSSGEPPDAPRIEQPVLRLVHILKHCGYGNGNVHVAIDLACMQARAGHDVTVVSAGGTFVPLLDQYGVRHVALHQDLRRPFASAMGALRFMRLCGSIRPHILHAHMMGSAVVAYLASMVTGVPLVTTVHNSFDWHSIIMRLGKRVVAVSHAERNHLLTRGWPPQKVTVVVNAPSHSPREPFMQNSRSFVLEHPCITAICGLHRRKGVHDLIDAFGEVAAAFADWHLYIAGEGPDSTALQRQVAAAGLSDRVTFLGFVASPQTLFEQSDIFVLASYADPGSLSIGEARSAGCAIVATAVGGTPEMLEYGLAGRLVQPGSPRQLAVELKRLMQDPDARAALREAALKGAESFDVHHLVERYEQVYQEAQK